jgi:hypothetical protein
VVAKPRQELAETRHGEGVILFIVSPAGAVEDHLRGLIGRHLGAGRGNRKQNPKEETAGEAAGGRARSIGYREKGELHPENLQAGLVARAGGVGSQDGDEPSQGMVPSNSRSRHSSAARKSH